MIASLWLALKASRGAKVAVTLLLIVAAILALYVWAMSQHNEAIEDAAQQGREDQQREDVLETLNRTMEANNAAEAVRTDPAARRDGCLRHSRTPENCR